MLRAHNITSMTFANAGRNNIASGGRTGQAPTRRLAFGPFKNDIELFFKCNLLGENSLKH